MNKFALLVGLGATLGLWQVARTVPSKEALRYAQIVLISLFGGLIGSRLIFVLTHSAYFSNHLGETVQFWLGGLSWPGAAIGIVATAAMAAVVNNISAGTLFDNLSPMLPPLVITTWLGCWQSGCAYGFIVPETAFWGIASLDETGAMLKRFPLQLLASLTSLAYFLWLESKLKSHSFPGRKAWLSGLGISVIIWIFSFFRADPAPLWFGFRMEGWAALGLSIFFLIALIINIQKQKGSKEFIRNTLRRE